MNPPDGHDVAVRIGDLQVAGPSSCKQLVAVGLGSCVGVVVVEPRSGTRAMAHVFLPEQPEHGSREEAGIGTYADRAIPALVRMVSDTSAVPSSRLVAVVAGGARMFGGRPGTDIGQRNVEAVRRALAAGGIRIVAEDVGGSSGRTMRAIVGSVAGSVAVTVREVASPQRTLWTTTRHRESPDRTAA